MQYKRYEKAVKVLYECLDRFVETYDGTRIVMFGTSVIAGMVVAYLRHRNLEVDFLIDNNKRKQGYHIFGLSIEKPSVLAENFDAGTRILIASSAQEQMNAQLEEMGYVKDKQIIWLINLPELMNDYSHLDRSGLIPVGMDECKKELVHTMELLNEVCKEHHLKYYIIAGTMIGAARHKGFIPWDDDIDLAMSVEDLYRLCEIVKNHPELRLICGFDKDVDFYGTISELYTERYIVDNNRFPMQYTAGVLIDIYPLIGLPGDGMCQENLDYMEGYRDLDMKQWGLLYDKEKCKKACIDMFHYLEKYPVGSVGYTGIAAEGYTQTILPYDYYATPVWVDFENIKLMAPVEYKKILVHSYGDYMQFPPPELRVRGHYYHAYQVTEEG